MNSNKVKVYILPFEDDIWVFDSAAQQSVFRKFARVIHGVDSGGSWITQYTVNTAIEIVFSIPPGDTQLPYPALFASPTPMSVDPRTPTARLTPAPAPFPFMSPTSPPVPMERDIHVVESSIRYTTMPSYMHHAHQSTLVPPTGTRSPPRTAGWIEEDSGDYVFILPSEDDIWVFDFVAQQSVFRGFARVIHGVDSGGSWITQYTADTPIEIVFSVPPGDTQLPYPALFASPTPMSVDPRTPTARSTPALAPFSFMSPTSPPVPMERDIHVVESSIRYTTMPSYMHPAHPSTLVPPAATRSSPHPAGWIEDDSGDSVAATPSSASPTSSEESDPIEDYSPLD
ncbi:uncharacterized protein LOC113859243 [Abrus precatorius]|uniref:Uncharacterized protein LOC113859243 n=1 Tax=Abrus precatorius TaxID=3816 RepID=A0A8B8KW30_ABRPR|nr:uncharacterized protein LOC113859243 [Abrus precatorius]